MDVGCWRYGCQGTTLDTDPNQTCVTFPPEDRLQAFDLRGVGDEQSIWLQRSSGDGGMGPNALKYQKPTFHSFLTVCKFCIWIYNRILRSGCRLQIILAYIFTSILVVFIEVSPDSILKTTNTMTSTFTLDFLYSSRTILPLAQETIWLLF